jgi:hypothetical protein
MTVLSRFRVVVGLVAILALAAACGVSDEPAAPSAPDPTATVVPTVQPTPEPAATDETSTGDIVNGASVDNGSCEGLLDPPPADLVLGTLTPDIVDATISGLQNMCMASYESADRLKGMTVALATFDSAANATGHYQTMVESLELDGMAEAESIDVGPDSSTAVVNGQGVGSFLFFRDGVYAVSIHTSMPDGEPALYELAGLEEIASGVRAKLAAAQ